MIATIAFALLLLSMLLVAQQYATVRSLRGKMRDMLPAPKDDDDGVRAYLEACAVTSPLAKRLAANTEAAGGEVRGVHAFGLVRGESVASEPSDAYWCRQDLEREDTDDDRLTALRRHIASGARFTARERSEILAAFSIPEVRHAAREALMPIALSPPSTPSPLPTMMLPGRWSRQRLAVLVFASCKHGNPTHTIRAVNGDMQISCRRADCEHTSIGIRQDRNMIFVDDDGEAWSIIDDKWVKRAID